MGAVFSMYIYDEFTENYQVKSEMTDEEKVLLEKILTKIEFK